MKRSQERKNGEKKDLNANQFIGLLHHLKQVFPESNVCSSLHNTYSQSVLYLKKLTIQDSHLVHILTYLHSRAVLHRIYLTQQQDFKVCKETHSNSRTYKLHADIREVLQPLSYCPALCSHNRKCRNISGALQTFNVWVTRRQAYTPDNCSAILYHGNIHKNLQYYMEL